MQIQTTLSIVPLILWILPFTSFSALLWKSSISKISLQSQIHMWPPPISNHPSKTSKMFSVKALYRNLLYRTTSHKWPWPLFCLTVYKFSNPRLCFKLAFRCLLFSIMNSRQENRSKPSFTARIITKYSLERFLSVCGEEMSKGFLKFCKLIIEPDTRSDHCLKSYKRA